MELAGHIIAPGSFHKRSSLDENNACVEKRQYMNNVHTRLECKFTGAGFQFKSLLPHLITPNVGCKGVTVEASLLCIALSNPD